MTETLLKKNGWKVAPLEELTWIIDGDRGVNYPKGDEFSTGGYCLFLNTKNVPDTKFSFSELSFISRNKDESMGKGKLNRGDFVLTTRGTLGNVAFYSDKISFENIRINSGMVILRIDENVLDKKYFYFYLRSPLFSQQVVQLSSGSAQPQLPIKDLKKFLINFPEDVEEQEEIAAVLSSIDDKIELLQKQSETMEKILNTVFYEWFVNFNFPDEQGNPYKSSGGKMIESELGEIPEGWKAGTLAEIIKPLNSRVGNDNQEEYKVMSAVNTGELVPSEDYFTKQVFSKSISKYIKIGKGDFAYNPARINIGSIGRLNLDVKGAISPVYVAFRAENGCGSFVDFLIKTQRIKKHIELFANGSVRQTLNYDGFAAFPLAIPSSTALAHFEQFSNSIHKIVKNKKEQKLILGKLIDILSPRLMNGDLTIKA